MTNLPTTDTDFDSLLADDMPTMDEIRDLELTRGLEHPSFLSADDLYHCGLTL